MRWKLLAADDGRSGVGREDDGLGGADGGGIGGADFAALFSDSNSEVDECAEALGVGGGFAACEADSGEDEKWDAFHGISGAVSTGARLLFPQSLDAKPVHCDAMHAVG